MANENGAVLFIGCFDFIHDETDEEGTFQIVVEARDVAEAAARCRDRLDEIARTTDILGPVIVFDNAFVEVSRGNLARGVLVNHQSLGDVLAYDYLPTQGLAGDEAHFLHDETKGEESGTVPPFWSGVDVYASKWKLYWCETDDHDEDWFVVARNADDARAFHEDAEGYDEEDARAELVCVLPLAEQAAAEKEGDHWPSDETLLACGAEFLVNVLQDGANELRAAMSSGSRVVRINGRVYGEGDIVGNVLQSQGRPTDA
ncbi:hypothetical protein WME89_48965 [Sorangium sp. So ce321]|uniref:hypothetical protein n=1 Tax=Sorangium sp. So ce321 TaxID=3133300 RepID=UPI003F5F3D16